MKWRFFCGTEWGRPELERALRFGDRAMCLEQLVVFAGAGRGDEMPVRVAGPGMGRSFAGGGMADHRPRRGVARGAPCCGDEEWGEERGDEKTGESHERPPVRMSGDSYAATRIAGFAREFWSCLRRRCPALVAVLDALERRGVRPL
jgi:hypothetical protein